MRSVDCLHVVSLLGALRVLFAGDAAAQIGRVGGVVKDEDGQPIKGATDHRGKREHRPDSFTATTDDKGRFTMIGLRAGQWRFIAQAPGIRADGGEMAVRIGRTEPADHLHARRTGRRRHTARSAASPRKDLQARAHRRRRAVQSAEVGRGDRGVPRDRRRRRRR